ncbi:hypothetical protein [Nostoc sp. FACHB-190]|uniref:hypothetical protein n=1 Tax=Nostoc sp. FACHB-190 TaxID=2692838 RepID=UPI001999136C|nr:hypothetical protein [Nostoc sp. FACHB-190]MBD2298147.1 hypothetical protein [Nostoc sp. FACHB-190]
MTRRNPLLIFILIAPFLAIALINLPFIPSWQSAQGLIFFGIWLLAVGLGILFLTQPQPLPIFKTKIFLMLYLLLSIGILLLILYIWAVSDIVDFKFKQIIQYPGYSKTFYLYEQTCFPPDTVTECGDYHGKVNTKIGFLPIMTTKFQCRCLFGEPEHIDNKVVIPLEANLDKAKSSLVINLNTGEIIQK